MDYSPIQNLKLEQLQNETEAWKKKLSFLMAENVQLKNSLAEVLLHKFDITRLEMIEEFHNKFLKEDELIQILRHDLSEFEKQLRDAVIEDGSGMKTVHSKMVRLKENISNFEMNFNLLKSGFNNYLTSY